MFRLSKIKDGRTWFLQSRSRPIPPFGELQLIGEWYNEFHFEEVCINLERVGVVMLEHHVKHNPYFIFHKILCFEKVFENGFKVMTN